MTTQMFVTSRPQAVMIAKEILRSRLNNRFGPTAVDPLDYHTRGHSEHVALWARKGLETIRELAPDLVPMEDLDLVEIEGLGHDLVQDCFKDPDKWRARWGGYKETDISPAMRERGMVRGNERASADEILEVLGYFIYVDGSLVFPVNDDAWCESISADIGTTYPKFEKTADGSPKVFQPYLLPETSLRGLCLANADLRSNLAESETVFWQTGNAELREWWWELTRYMRCDGDLHKIPQDGRARIATQILDWIRDQVGFAREQRKLFLGSIAGNDILNAHAVGVQIQWALCELYGLLQGDEGEDGNFENNIVLAHRRYLIFEDRFGHLTDAECRKQRLDVISVEDIGCLLTEVGYSVSV